MEGGTGCVLVAQKRRIPGKQAPRPVSNLETIGTARNGLDGLGAQRHCALDRTPQRFSSLWRGLGGSIRYNDNTVSEAGDEPYIAAAFGGAAAVSDLLVDEGTGEMTIVFAVPIISYDDVVGVLLGERGYDTLGDIVDHLAFGEQGWAYILNEQGTVMAHPNRELVLGGISVFDQSSPLAPVGEALAQLDSTGDSVIRYQTGDGTRRIDGVTPISMTGWTLAVGAIESDVLGNIESCVPLCWAYPYCLLPLGLVPPFSWAARSPALWQRCSG